MFTFALIICKNYRNDILIVLDYKNKGIKTNVRFAILIFNV